MQKNDEQYGKMIHTPIAKLVLTLSVPTIVSMLITSAYNVADTYFVSQLGTSASGAIGIVFSLMAIIQAVGFTVGMGSGSAISRLLGKKKVEKAQEMASSALALSILLGIILSITGLLFLEKLMVLLGATKTILPYAIIYAKYILYTAPVMMASFVLNNLLRAEGKSKFAMIGIGVGGILNIFLDPFLIFGLKMGMEGAALATAISQIVGFSVLLACYLFKKTMICFSVRNIARDFSVYKVFLGNGMPSLFRQGLASVASVVLNHVAAVQGDATVAAMSIVSKIFMVVFCVLIGLGQGYQPVAGYNYGAKEYERLKKAYRFMLWVGVCLMTVLAIGLYAWAPWLLERFVSDDEKVREIGVLALRMQCVVMPLMPLGIACNMTFQAVGKSVTATFLAACRQGVFFLPLIFVLPKWFGVFGIGLAQPVADAATFLVCIPFIYRFFKS